MSEFINIRTTRHNQYTARMPGPIHDFMNVSNIRKIKFKRGFRKKRIIGSRFENRRGSRISFLGKQEKLLRLSIRLSSLRTKKTQECQDHNHNWNNEGVNPEYCLDCGISIWAEAFNME